MRRAIFVVLDGADGTGKDTQAPLLVEAAKERGLKVAFFKFPEYETETGQDIVAYQRGDFGELSEVNPKLACYLYAANRFQARGRLLVALQSNDLVIAKRYVPSNVVYGSARVAAKERVAFQTWVEQLDYHVMGNPKEDAVVYLDLPVVLSNTLIAKRKLQRRDINDEDQGFRQAVRDEYLKLAANRRNWHSVSCATNDTTVRSIEDIGDEIQRVVFDMILAKATPAATKAAQ